MAKLDLTGGDLDLIVKRGDGVGFYLPLPTDLHLWAWVGEVRALDDGDELIGSFTFDLDAVSATLRLSSLVTSALPDVSAWSVRVHSGSGDPTTLLEGRIFAKGV